VKKHLLAAFTGSLRAASHQATSGVQSRGLQALLGHKDALMTVRYSHLTDVYLRAAVDRVNLGQKQPTFAQS